MIHRIISFSRVGRLGLILSFVITSSLIGITIYRGGFNLGIDFRSGQSIDMQLNEAPISEDIEALLRNDFVYVIVTRVGNANEGQYNVKLPSTIDSQEGDLVTLISLLEKEYGSVEILSTAFIGPNISNTLFRSVLFLAIGALGLILIYIWVRFKLQFAIAALIALLHDTIFILGVVGALQFEVTVSTIAAVLTIIGYSLNDTIVIFDRMRENIVLIRDANFTKMTNISITQTLSRTLITSLTTLLAVIALIIFATGEVYNFARTLMIGIIEGTWSSLFIATPILSFFNHEKIFGLYRRKQGSGVKYVAADSRTTGAPVATTDGSSSVVLTDNTGKGSMLSGDQIEKIKQELLQKRQHKKKRR